jgi:hypothetical protein
MTGKPKELSAERLAEDENVMIAISRLEYLADVNARANSTKASDECRGFSDLLTRLSRENAALKVERDRWKFCVERFEDRALTARAIRETRDALDAIDDRVQKLSDWIAENGPECAEEQKHLDADSQERLYWHYGYLMALRDVRDLLNAKRRSLN